MNPTFHCLPSRALAIAVLLAAGAARADITVQQPWIRATVPQQKATGAFLTLRSTEDTTLVEARSPVAAVAEVHEMAVEDNVMKMRQVPALAVPAGRPVELRPGGYHVMLLDLQRQLKEGEEVPLTLVFRNARGGRESIDVQVPVRGLNPSSNAPGHDAHRH
ncbi:copper chaperone PCu(A)C [Xylophilus sp.]|uniref:copper chaperone PCu(A)C n=1 Tax=Xylophilus sp. TaxID=2653893 RepID=UPI0013B88B11|nr:copper chaperone PCu(A)C [Xylophilus sp.]KAF1045523.1 MAG: hypothetical protein GAK38_02972 [Xylophilus sp.]